MTAPSPSRKEVSNARRQTNRAGADVSARGYRGWLAGVVNAKAGAEIRASARRLKNSTAGPSAKGRRLEFGQ
jgi:hypothetical protein